MGKPNQDLINQVSKYLKTPKSKPKPKQATKPVKLFSETVREAAFNQPVESEPVKPITELMKEGRSVSEAHEPRRDVPFAELLRKATKLN